MTLLEAVILIFSGVFVGFINTLAGGGTIISLSVLMFMGLPANIANGTNRIAIMIQTMAAVGSFRHQKVLDHKKGFRLGLPALLGSILGAWIAVDLDKETIEKAIAVMMLVMVVTVFHKPQMWLKGKVELQEKPVSIMQMVIFFLIGIYGGFLHLGVGYVLLAGIVLGAGYDLVKANAIKNLITFLWSPVILIVFFLHGQVYLLYGLVLSIGSVAGALIATRMAVQQGAGFVRWVIVVVILLTTAQVFGVIDIKSLLTP
jgi:uncharacterized protein